MKTRIRLVAGACLATAALIPAAADAGTTTVKRPKAGSTFTGITEQNGRLQLKISASGKYVRIVAFQFACNGTAVTGLKNLRLKKTSTGYKFGAGSRSSIAFEDDSFEEGFVAVAGKFTKGGRKVRGAFRLQSPSCPDTGQVDWAAVR